MCCIWQNIGHRDRLEAIVAVAAQELFTKGRIAVAVSRIGPKSQPGTRLPSGFFLSSPPASSTHLVPTSTCSYHRDPSKMTSESNNKPRGPIEPPWTQPNGISATYACHCHCGAVRWDMTLSPPLYAEQTQGKEQCVAAECNCSHCERHGSLAVHPLATDIVFTKGLEASHPASLHRVCAHCAV